MVQVLRCNCPKLTVADIRQVKRGDVVVRIYTCVCSVHPNLFEEVNE